MWLRSVCSFDSLFVSSLFPASLYHQSLPEERLNAQTGSQNIDPRVTLACCLPVDTLLDGFPNHKSELTNTIAKRTVFNLSTFPFDMASSSLNIASPLRVDLGRRSGKTGSQFHHYLPRFMLRKWKVDYAPRPESEETTQFESSS